METVGDRVDRALAFLAREQRPTGEFLVVRGRRLTRLERTGWVGARRCLRPFEGGTEIRAVFATALVARTAMRFPASPRARAVLAAARAHLAEQREPSGLWCWYGRGAVEAPPDVDDTAYALLAVPGLERERATMERMRGNADGSGALLTWFEEPGRPRFESVVDPVVNANALALFQGGGLEAPLVVRHLEECLARRSYRRGTPYYASPAWFLCATSRVASALSPDAVGRLDREIERAAARGGSGPVVDAALLAAALLARGRPAPPPLLDVVLDAQREDGGWDVEPAFRGTVWWGARAITTALALDAIGGGAG